MSYVAAALNLLRIVRAMGPSCVQSWWVVRAEQHGTQGRPASPHRLDVVVGHAMPVVPQMVDLHGMHGPEHEDAQHQHHPIRGGARKAQRIVEGVAIAPRAAIRLAQDA
jgi:hypothetical protein